MIIEFAQYVWGLARVDSGEEFWSAVSSLAAMLVGWVALRIARYQLDLDLAPVLVPERKNKKTIIRNVGSGAAFDVIAVSPDGNAIELAAILGNTDVVEYSPGKLTITRSHHVFYRDQLRRWFRLKLVGASFLGDDLEYRIGIEVRPWRSPFHRLPKSVRMKLARARTVSAEEHLVALTSLFHAAFWRLRIGNRLKDRRRKLERWFHGRGEETRRQKYDAFNKGFPSSPPPDEDRLKWDLDVSGLITCWHTSAIDLEQYSCEDLTEGGIVCKVGLVSPFPPRTVVQGLLVVAAPAWSKLIGRPRSQRNDLIWRLLSDYVCGRYPKEFFVCEVKSV